jgi:hypothetical protein
MLGPLAHNLLCLAVLIAGFGLAALIAVQGS